MTDDADKAVTLSPGSDVATFWRLEQSVAHIESQLRVGHDQAAYVLSVTQQFSAFLRNGALVVNLAGTRTGHVIACDEDSPVKWDGIESISPSGHCIMMHCHTETRTKLIAPFWIDILDDGTANWCQGEVLAHDSIEREPWRYLRRAGWAYQVNTQPFFSGSYPGNYTSLYISDIGLPGSTVRASSCFGAANTESVTNVGEDRRGFLMWLHADQQESGNIQYRLRCVGAESSRSVELGEVHSHTAAELIGEAKAGRVGVWSSDGSRVIFRPKPLFGPERNGIRIFDFASTPQSESFKTRLHDNIKPLVVDTLKQFAYCSTVSLVATALTSIVLGIFHRITMAHACLVGTAVTPMGPAIAGALLAPPFMILQVALFTLWALEYGTRVAGGWLPTQEHKASLDSVVGPDMFAFSPGP